MQYDSVKTHILTAMLKFALVFLSMMLLSLFSLSLWSYFHVSQRAASSICYDLNCLPKEKAGLLLGTSPKQKDGATNLYFRYRIEAAAMLFNQGKINYIIVSGDNRKENYNEPKEMRKALIQMGIPDTAIIADYAGFRTLDSVVRCLEVFDQKSVIIISQLFHLERALYLAQISGLNATGFVAQDVPEQYGVKTRLREFGARIKAIADVHVFKTKPKFYGPKVLIGTKD